jgi:hypothetical protein
LRLPIRFPAAMAAKATRAGSRKTVAPTLALLGLMAPAQGVKQEVARTGVFVPGSRDVTPRGAVAKFHATGRKKNSTAPRLFSGKGDQNARTKLDQKSNRRATDSD